MDKIKYENFKNICRMCMLECCINFNKDAVIKSIFHKLTDIHFENDELPQQICLKCFDFVNEIHAFSMTCKHTHSALIECLNDYKNKGIKEEQEIIEETNEEMDITIEEYKIDFVDELDNDMESNNLLNKDVIELPVNLLPPVSISIQTIQTENEDDSQNIINSNDLNNLDSESSGNIIFLRNKKKVIKTTKDKQNKCKIRIGTSKKEHKRKHIIEHPTVPAINDKVQRRRYKCDQCEKAFTSARDLNVHIRVHSGERPYQCDQCKKSFSILSNLNVHKRRHTGERPHKCDQCKKSFNSSSDLIRHKRLHTGERPYKCDQCEKSYSTASALMRHKRIHTGKRLYKCNQCEKSFLRSDHLKDHIRVHTGERPYKCDLCENSFINLSSLKHHKRMNIHDVK